MNKKIYEVTITEKLLNTIEVIANSEEEAIEIIKDKYRDEEIVLSPDDFFEVEFSAENIKHEHELKL